MNFHISDSIRRKNALERETFSMVCTLIGKEIHFDVADKTDKFSRANYISLIFTKTRDASTCVTDSFDDFATRISLINY